MPTEAEVEKTERKSVECPWWCLFGMNFLQNKIDNFSLAQLQNCHTGIQHAATLLLAMSCVLSTRGDRTYASPLYISVTHEV